MPLILAGCAVLVLGLIASAACVIFLVLPAVQSNQTFMGRLPIRGLGLLTPTKTPTKIGTPTPRSTVSPARTPQPSGTPATTNIKLGSETLAVKQVILADDFSDASNGWDEESVEGLYKYVQDGQYHIEVRGKNVGSSSMIGASDTLVTSDFVLQINAHAELGPKDNVYGIVYGDSNRSEYYEFDISDAGQIRIRYWPADTNAEPTGQKLVPWQDTKWSASQTQWNTLTIVRKGQTLSFYVNGSKVQTLQDSKNIQPDEIGVYSGAFDEPTSVAFDNLLFATLR